MTKGMLPCGIKPIKQEWSVLLFNNGVDMGTALEGEFFIGPVILVIHRQIGILEIVFYRCRDDCSGDKIPESPITNKGAYLERFAHSLILLVISIESQF